MINKAFDIVNRKVEATLSEQGYVRKNVTGTDSNELVTLYTGESAAYSVLYYKDKKHMVMRSCSMTEDGPDNEWKTIGTWIFDPSTDGEREAESIGNDFAENVSSPLFVQASKVQKKKKKNSDDGSGDPLFFSKRLVAVFPELKDEIKAEEDGYEQFRGVLFAREFIVPKIDRLLRENKKSDIDKLADILSAQYGYCDLDTRSIITIVEEETVIYAENGRSEHREQEGLYESAQSVNNANLSRRNYGQRQKYSENPLTVSVNCGKINLPRKGFYFLCPFEGG